MYYNYIKDANIMQEVLRDEKNGKKQNWRGHKIAAVDLGESYSRLGFDRKSFRVTNCGNSLIFKRFDTGEMKLHKADFCKVRLCPMCAWRRSLKVFGQVSKVMEYLTEHEDYRYIFLTLTAKNVDGDNLAPELDKLFYAFKKLTKRREFLNLSKGWFRCLEITHNWERNDYHPHFHIVVAVTSSYFKETLLYLKQEKWVDLWQSCLGVDYKPIVDVRTVKPSDSTGKNFSKAVAEVAKYAVKPSDYIIKPCKEQADWDVVIDACNEITDRAVSVIDAALHNRRLVAFGGKFKEVHKMLNLDDTIDGDLINTDNDDVTRDDLGYIIVKFQWNVGYRNYLLD